MHRLCLLLVASPMLALAGCESCGFTFGVRGDAVDLTLSVGDNEVADDARASAIVAAARVEVCRRDHDGRSCEEAPLGDLLDGPVSDGQTASIDLGGLYDGESYAHLVKCYFPGLEVTVESPGCTDATLEWARANSEHASVPEQQSLVLACEA